MGKIVVTEFITLDGVVEDPGGAEDFPHGGWSFKFDRGAEGDKFKYDELMAAEVQLLGRVTYSGFAKAWPAMNDSPFGEKMNTMPKYVLSTTLSAQDASWENSTVLPDLAAVAEMKQQVAGDILIAGSATLVRALAADGLVDEYRLMVFPVVLGGGKRLFGEGFPHTVLRPVETLQLGSQGVFVVRCEVG